MRQVISAILCFLALCSASLATDFVNVKINSGLQVFGHSIAAGANATSSSLSYASRVGALIGGTVDNKAVGGSGGKGVTQQGYTYLPYGTRSRPVLWDGALNDVRRGGANAPDHVEKALDAFIATAFTGGARPASHSQVVRTGAWTALGSSWGGRAFPLGGTPMYTNDINATMSMTFTAPTVAVHAYITNGTTGYYQDLSVTIDGVEHICGLFGKAIEQAAAAACVYHGLGAGSHTITIRPTNNLAWTVVDTISFPTPVDFAPLLVGEVGYISNWATYGAIGTLADAEATNVRIRSVVDRWRADGFPVAYVETNTGYLASRDDATDGIHPHNSGMANYAIPFMNAIRVNP